MAQLHLLGLLALTPVVPLRGILILIRLRLQVLITTSFHELLVNSFRGRPVKVFNFIVTEVILDNMLQRNTFEFLCVQEPRECVDIHNHLVGFLSALIDLL